MLGHSPEKEETGAALVSLLQHASVTSPFYRDCRWAERLRGGKEIVFAEDVAITAKASVREDASRFHAERVPEADGKVIDKFTSGSTGEPIHVRKTARHFRLNERENTRLKEGWGIDRHRAVLAVKSARTDAPFGSVDAHSSGGRTSWTLAGLDSTLALALVREHRITMMHSYPSVAEEVLKLAAERNEALSLALVVTVGEILSEEFQDVARRQNCRIVDTYGTVETGIIAGLCATCGRYHPADRHLVFEVLNEVGSPVGPGGIGRVVVTPLYNSAMPLIRYETGDFVELAEDGDCIRSSIAIRRIVGRERNMFILPDGRKVTPMIPARTAQELGIRQFKLVQTTREDVDIRYVLREGASPPETEPLQGLIDAYLSPGLRAHPRQVAEIPRAPGGKYLMHECLV
jgi:phenylacetate-CoA ligase